MKRAEAQRQRRARERTTRRSVAQIRARTNAKVSQDQNEDIRAGINVLEPLWLPFYPQGSLHGGQKRPAPAGYFDGHADHLVIR